MADTDTLRQDTARCIGRRISVRGHTGSGKTTVARQLGSALGLPVVELDTLFWRPNWQETPLEEFRAKVVEALAKHDDGWVCGGNYNSAVADLVLPMADTVVWLRPPFRVAFWRLLKRTIIRSWTGETLWGINRESFQKSFLSRDSILLWAITHRRAHVRDTRKALAGIPHHATVIELRSACEVEEWLRSLGQGADTSFDAHTRTP